MSDLLARHSKGGAPRLSPDAVAALLAAVPGWWLREEGAALERTFRFTNFHETMAFANAVAWIAHGEDHHPDLGVHYDRCDVRWSTHDAGGLTENDFICAAKVSALLPG